MLINIYLIGCLIAFILGCYLLYKTEDKTNLQFGMIAPITLLSWISVAMIIWKRDNLF